MHFTIFRCGQKFGWAKIGITGIMKNYCFDDWRLCVCCYHVVTDRFVAGHFVTERFVAGHFVTERFVIVPRLFFIGRQDKVSNGQYSLFAKKNHGISSLGFNNSQSFAVF